MVYEQPPIVNVSVERKTNCPSAFTLLLEVEGVTVPPCGHDIELVMVRKGDAIT